MVERRGQEQERIRSRTHPVRGQEVVYQEGSDSDNSKSYSKLIHWTIGTRTIITLSTNSPDGSEISEDPLKLLRTFEESRKVYLGLVRKISPDDVFTAYLSLKVGKVIPEGLQRVGLSAVVIQRVRPCFEQYFRGEIMKTHDKGVPDFNPLFVPPRSK